jgi:hypothetical protein
MRTFKDKIIRQRINSRGGGIEIDLQEFGHNGRMTAYQNYLGGGMLGCICSDCTIKEWESDPKLEAIALELRKYFHSLTNPDTEWEGAEYEQVQLRPKSAY